MWTDSHNEQQAHKKVISRHIFTYSSYMYILCYVYHIKFNLFFFGNFTHI